MPRRREALVDPAAEADRARAGAHQHAAVGGRAEVVEEHPAVGDRLAAGPADLGEQLGHGLGEHDVAAERRQQCGRAASSPPPRRSWRRRPPAHARSRASYSSSPSSMRETLVRSCRRTPAASACGAAPARAAPDARWRRRGRRRRAGRPAKNSGAPARRATAGPPPPRRRARGRRPASGRGSRPARATSRRAAAHPRAARRRARERARPGWRRRRARDSECPLGSEHVAEAREARPVAVEEAAVPPAGADPATRGLEHDDVQRGLPPLQLERRPEAGEAAADDGDVGPRVALERGLLGIRRRVLEPPGGGEPGATVSACSARPTPRPASRRAPRRCGRTPPAARRAAARSGSRDLHGRRRGR